MAKGTRTRSGCLRCRSRKRKCNGERPRCSHCLNRGEECCYGIKASFHPSRELTLSNDDSAVLLALEVERGGDQHLATRFVDNTSQIVREYEEPLAASPNILGPSGKSNHRSTTSTGQSEVFKDGTASEDIAATTVPPTHTLNSHEPSDVETSHGNSPSVSRSVSGFPLNESSFIAPAYHDLELPVPKAEQIRLIHAYLKETGIWCEATDSGKHFTVTYIHPLMNNKPFAAAAMALASRQLDAVRQSPRESTLDLYQYAVQSLLHYEPSQCGEATLACCVLLSVYEMITHEVGAAEWRRHLKGCVFNLMNKGWSGSSPALVGAAFWAFARIDVWTSYVLAEKTLVSPESWVDDDSPTSITTTRNIDDYCNLATLLLAKIVNLVGGSSPIVEYSSVSAEIYALWLGLQQWYSHRPRQIGPLMRTDSDGTSVFPTILLTGDSSICGHTMYHAGCMLLLRTGQISHKSSNIPAEIYNPIWHAKELCGMSIMNVSHAGWINQVFPLYIAGLIFGTAGSEDGEEYAIEKFALLKHLARIERETGWPTSRKATELRKCWGLG
ncbi:hypothetical protein IQ07DRAFT_546297 [Pyrenochaeta sp. DS3sAY3a]|nr:hypothetical protein IQ07DRAFT_546297 [Pyrenochaeta sp. DS3sAY3a]